MTLKFEKNATLCYRDAGMKFFLEDKTIFLLQKCWQNISIDPFYNFGLSRSAPYFPSPLFIFDMI